ncbi:MAG: penicillin-binding protein 2 [Acidobacteriota bacterium]
MELQQDINKQFVQQRLNVLRYPVLLIFLVLIARLWQLQILHGPEYTVKAENNRVRTIDLAAPRGIISDREGRTLAENRSSFTVYLYRESIKDENATIEFLADELGLDPEEVKTKLTRSKKTGLFRPIPVKEAAGVEDISVIEAQRREYPEIQVLPEPRRLYRYGNLASHLIGYVGEITEAELGQQQFPSAEAGSLVGQSGIERFYNECLVGRQGERLALVDSRGREVGLLEDEKSPVIGGEVRLTLDLDVQLAAEKALEGKVGAVVAMNPLNGQILAMASAPSFDPNAFSTRLSYDDWQALLEDPDHPMQNRCIQNAYAPGSIFKLIMAEAGLAEKVLDNNTSVVCTGSKVYFGRSFGCGSKEGHGRVRLEEAIARSCNIFFYDLGLKLGISKISEYAGLLGLGDQTGIDLPGERSGIVPSQEWKERTQGEPWYPGETIPVSIGQGAISTTPLQILRAVSVIANGGDLVTPHLLLHADRKSVETDWPLQHIPVLEDDIRKIREGMWHGVNDGGTGHNAAIPGRDICGKTGTAQVMSRETEKRFPGAAKDHAWFAGFSSKENPEIAVVVFVEHGGQGGVVAAPLAREIFKAYFENRE